jgi:GR25 family glycosyltransferase involved in LPS biosynthesis
MKYFDHIFFINLDRRPDRLELITEQLKKVNIEAERVTAVDGSLLDADPKIGNGWNHKGVAGCALSHRKVIQLAKEHNYNNFLVIEDDSIFTESFVQDFEFYIKQVPENWDMIYFGGNHLTPLKGINTNVGKCQHTLTTNMYAMKHTLYDTVLSSIAPVVEGLDKPVDVLYCDIQKKYNCYGFKPHLVWQDSIFSDIENKSQDLPFLRPNVPKISLIISSCNQKDRLRYSLKSAIIQNYYNYEVIVADDNSADGTIEMIEQEFPGVKISINPFSEKGVYTLAENWNTAAKLANGDRLIFTNADCIFPPTYITAHADPIMKNDIIFGPNERTDENIVPLLGKNLTPKEFLTEYLKTSSIGKDLRHDTSAYTYNTEYNYHYPWGNNFSVPREAFLSVNGFPKLKEYGGEEILLNKKLNTKRGLKIKSNCNTINIHLWHPVIHSMKAPFNEYDHNNYIEG